MTAIVKTLPVGLLQCNCVIVGDPKSLQAVVIDPGCEVEWIQNVLRKHNLQVAHILITHGHFDHFLAAHELKDREGGKALVHVHNADNFLWQKWEQQLNDFGHAEHTAIHIVRDPDASLNDNQVFDFGELSVRCLHTPGHSPGSMSFYFEDVNIVASGDTLFRGGVGRTTWFNIPSLDGSSDPKQLRESIKKQLLVLPENTRVIPGHGQDTSISHEKHNNPYCR